MSDDAGTDDVERAPAMYAPGAATSGFWRPSRVGPRELKSARFPATFAPTPSDFTVVAAPAVSQRNRPRYAPAVIAAADVAGSTMHPGTLPSALSVMSTPATNVPSSVAMYASASPVPVDDAPRVSVIVHG